MSSIINTFKEARTLDMQNLLNTTDMKESYDTKRNMNGRKFIIGSIVGAFRVINNVVAIPFNLIGATFALLGAGVTRLFGNERLSDKALASASKCGENMLDNIKHIARGIVEIVPFTGYALAKYDIAQHQR